MGRECTVDGRRQRVSAATIPDDDRCRTPPALLPPASIRLADALLPVTCARPRRPPGSRDVVRSSGWHAAAHRGRLCHRHRAGRPARAALRARQRVRAADPADLRRALHRCRCWVPVAGCRPPVSTCSWASSACPSSRLAPTASIAPAWTRSWRSMAAASCSVPRVATSLGFLVASARRRWARGARLGPSPGPLARRPWLIGSALIYGCGVVWLALAADLSLSDALVFGLWPFLPGDVLKLRGGRRPPAAGLAPGLQAEPPGHGKDRRARLMAAIVTEALTKTYAGHGRSLASLRRGPRRCTTSPSRSTRPRSSVSWVPMAPASRPPSACCSASCTRPPDAPASWATTSPRHSEEIRRRTGYLPGGIAFYDTMTGEEQLRYLAALDGRPAPLRDELIERMELSRARPAAARSVTTRAACARSSASSRPSSTTRSWPSSTSRPRDSTRSCSARSTRSSTIASGPVGPIFFSSHILSEVERVCDRVAIVRQGELVALSDVARAAGAHAGAWSCVSPGTSRPGGVPGISERPGAARAC